MRAGCSASRAPDHLRRLQLFDDLVVALEGAGCTCLRSTSFSNGGRGRWPPVVPRLRRVADEARRERDPVVRRAEHFLQHRTVQRHEADAEAPVDAGVQRLADRDTDVERRSDRVGGVLRQRLEDPRVDELIGRTCGSSRRVGASAPTTTSCLSGRPSFLRTVPRSLNQWTWHRRQFGVEAGDGAS